MASENNSVICDEVFEEGCQPSNEEILEYAVRIGIAPDKEPQLLHLARDGLMQALPADWKVCFHKTQGIYYHNLGTKESQWEHPLDEEYKRLVEQTRHRVAAAAADPDDTSSLLDSGIRSLVSTNNSMDVSLRSGVGLASRTLLPLERRVIKLQPLDGPQQQQRNIGPLLSQQQIDLKITTPSSTATDFASLPATANGPAAAAAVPVKGLQIFGAGSMFLKSNNARKPIESFAAADDKTENSSSLASNWAASSVKGILRDSSLSDVKNKSGGGGEAHRLSESENGEDRKSVRFNLVRRSGDLQPTVVKSSDESSNDDDDDDDDDGDGFDDDGAVAAAPSSVEEPDFRNKPPIAGNAQSKPTATKPIAPKLSLRTQFSLDDYRKPPQSAALRTLGRTFSTDSASEPQQRSGSSATSSFFDRKTEKSAGMNTAVKPLYDDNTTDSESSTKPLDDAAARETMRRQLAERLEAFRVEIQREQKQQEDAMRRNMQRELSDFNAALHKDSPENASLLDTTRAELDQQLADAVQKMRTEHAVQMRTDLAAEHRQLQQQYDAERQQFESQHQQRMQRLADEFQQNTDEYQAELETRQNLEISNHEQQLKLDFDRKQAEISVQHRAAVDTLQRNHTEIFNDLERDLKSEAELLRKEHTNNLAQVRVKLEHELEVEKQRMRDTGELQQFEKLRCEKRLLEDKYRCLKEKYVRLKTDVKVRLERQGHSRRSQHPQQPMMAQQAPGSETDRSFSLGHRGVDDGGHSVDHQRGGGGGTHSSSGGTTATTATATPPSNATADHGKPPAAPATPQLSSRGRSRDKSRERRISSSGGSGGGGGASAPAASKDHHSVAKPFGAAVKYLSHLHQHQQQQQQPDDTTSFSQSDTTVSNNFSHGKYLPPSQTQTHGDNGNSDTEAFRRNQENNNHGARDTRKKQFTRLKSASTSRLNATPAVPDVHATAAGGQAAAAAAMRPCTPMESLRLQLQKLEDLEDQFPENAALLLDTTHPYHLRYPFKDVAHLAVAAADQQPTAMQTTATSAPNSSSSSELEFFKHRIHMERDALRRAKEALRTQRTNFRMRQREIKQSSGVSGAVTAGRALDMQIEEAKELTDMEVGLHRTRALLGEKVIRLRHLEQSLQRLYEKEKPAAVAVQQTEAVGMGAHKKHQQLQQQQQQLHRLLPQQRDEAATVSDLSSHSSSGFSSTEYATDTLHTKRGGETSARPDAMDIVQSLEHLNAEIREIWEILSRQRTTQGLPPPPTMSMDWPGASGGGPASYGATQSHFQAGGQQQTAAPTFFDRLETYRQFAANRGPIGSAGGPAGGLLSTLAANTIVSQAPQMHGGGGGAVGGGGGGGYTTSLVERTQDLRNWLRQAKNEHELLSAGPQTDL